MGLVQVNPIFTEAQIEEEFDHALRDSRCLRVTFQRGFAAQALKLRTMVQKEQIKVTVQGWERIVLFYRMDPWKDLKYEGERSVVIRIPEEKEQVKKSAFVKSLYKYLANIEAVESIDIDDKPRPLDARSTCVF